MSLQPLRLGLIWMSIWSAGQEPQALPPPPPARLDGGLLDPAWFGPVPSWSRDWRVDYFWCRPGARLDPPVVYLVPWEEPRFLSSRDVLDHARGGEAAEVLQRLIRHRLRALPGLRLADRPTETPYHALGRVVEATAIRQGASATFGILAGLPTQTWDFKLVDLRTGAPLLAAHHRSVGAPATTWFTTLEGPLRIMAGLPPFAWEMPADSQPLEGGGRVQVAPGLKIPRGGLEVGPWTAESDQGGLSKAWANGVGANLAELTEATLRDRLEATGESAPAGVPAAFLLTGQIASSLSQLKPRYRAWVTEIATGRVVARYEALPPFSTRPAEAVGERIAAHLANLGSPAPGPPSPDLPPRRPPTAWEGRERLAPVGGGTDRAWVAPAFRLEGRALQLADWDPPHLGPEASGHERAVATALCARAPAWLFGAFAAHPDRRFSISRQGGDLRLEGRVVQLSQGDLRQFGTGLAGALTFGLATRSQGVLQVRLLDVRTGETLVLVEQELVSFQVASSGVDYKAMKWLAQSLVPLLLAEGGRPTPHPGAEPRP